MAKISDRLLEIYKQVRKDSIVADIGTDHAILPISLVENRVVKKAIATDIAKGPLDIAVNAIDDTELTEQIEVRQGSGFGPINSDDNVSDFVIAGMGGELISSMIENVKKDLFSVGNRLIIQPNNEEKKVRKSLIKTNFKINFENIIFESGHYYEVIVAEKIENKINYSNLEIEFGPILMKNKSQVFLDKWNKELSVLLDIKKKLDSNNDNQKNRLFEIDNSISKIKEVINV